MADHCPHLHEPTHDAWKRLRNPLKWACDSCYSTDGIWCCLSCGHIGCGRRAHLPALGGGHSKHHYHTSSIIEDKKAAISKGSGKGGKKKRVKILRVLRSNSSNLKKKNNSKREVVNAEGNNNNDKDRGIDANDDHSNSFCEGHEVCIDIVSKAVHCYACDDYVLSDAPWLAELRGELKGIELRREDSSVGGTTDTSSAHSSQHDDDNEDDTDFEIVDHPSEAVKSEEAPEFPPLLDANEFPPLSSVKSAKTPTADKVVETPPPTHRPPPEYKPGITGLDNLGNTCYMNSVLQMLSHCSGFRSFFRDFLRAAAPLRLAGEGAHSITRQSTVRLKDAFVEDHSPEKLALTEATHALLRVLWSGRWSSISPRYFVNAVWKHSDLFAARKQQDANEFLNFYLGRVDDELRPPKATSSVLMDLFGVDQYQEVQCDECKTVTKKTEPLLGLVLSIPDKIDNDNDDDSNKSDVEMINQDETIDLMDCFNSLRTTGRFIGENQFDCDTCHAKKDASWSVSLQRRPQSLLISLRRTLWTSEKGLHKDSRRVKFPLELDASDLLGTSRTSPDDDFEGCHYSLISVVSHSGSSPFVGHYFSFGRLGVDGNAWYLFNDSNVTPATESTVLEAEAFILMYESRGIPSV